MYSCLKHFSLPVSAMNEPPCRIAIDAYPFLYRFRENVNECIEVFESFRNVGHQITIFLDGTPPKEKMEELANRRKQKEVAYQQAKALRLFLQDEEKVGQLDDEAKKVLEKQIVAYELESWSIRKEIREKFIEICKEKEFPLEMCIGESDTDLIQGALQGKYDIVVANDMDLFVGGVERLWVLGKTSQDPLFQEFSRSMISHRLGIYPSSWVDIALLTGYEKSPNLKRCSAQQAITYMRYYKNLETLFAKRVELLGENTLEEYQKARSYLTF